MDADGVLFCWAKIGTDLCPPVHIFYILADMMENRGVISVAPMFVSLWRHNSQHAGSILLQIF